MDEQTLERIQKICRFEAHKRFKRVGYLRTVIDLEDLEQEAMIGALRAINSFNEEKGNFDAWVRLGACHALQKFERDISGQDHVVYEARKRVLDERQDSGGEKRNSEEISKRTGIPIEIVVEVLKTEYGSPISLVSLDAPVGEDEEGEFTLKDIIADRSRIPELKNSKAKKIIEYAFGQISEREQRVLELSVVEDMTIDEIAQEVHLSRESVLDLLRWAKIRASQSSRGRTNGYMD